MEKEEDDQVSSPSNWKYARRKRSRWYEEGISQQLTTQFAFPPELPSRAATYCQKQKQQRTGMATMNVYSPLSTTTTGAEGTFALDESKRASSIQMTPFLPPHSYSHRHGGIHGHFTMAGFTRNKDSYHSLSDHYSRMDRFVLNDSQNPSSIHLAPVLPALNHRHQIDSQGRNRETNDHFSPAGSFASGGESYNCMKSDYSEKYGSSSSSEEFQESQFQLEELLGQGHFGKIYRATVAKTNLMENDTSTSRGGSPSLYSVALKRFSKSKVLKANRRSGRLVQLLRREMGIHQRLDHLHILTYFGHIDGGSTHLSLVLEYAPYGDLFGYMDRIPTSLEELTVARHVMRQISMAVHYLRGRSIAHRDIKPENILVFRENNGMTDVKSPLAPTHEPLFKLCDFGWAVRFSPSTRQTTLCGTPEYVPIEMLRGSHRRNRNDGCCADKISYDAQYVDLWAMGVLMYELLHGKTPFVPTSSEEEKDEWMNDVHNQKCTSSSRKGSRPAKSYNTQLVYENIRSFQGATELEVGVVSNECFHLMDSLLQVDPTKRCSALEAANHVFLSCDYMS